MAKEIEFGKIIGKGKRGIVYAGKFNEKICAIKVKNPKSTAIGRIENESRWLKIMNKHGIGPRYYCSFDNTLIMEHLEGVHLGKFRGGNAIFKKILLQCRTMDKLKVNKYEMHKINKNAIVVKNKPVLIDFERCKIVLEPKNVTQFCQFLIRKGLCKDKSKAIISMKKYKKNMCDETFTSLVKEFF
ncbi:MAG: hypothetical protein Q8Q42_01635 [Nanoarchaeota archaeon]|nr:hypothetical protein [Nanoarchaeota archaeon]